MKDDSYGVSSLFTHYVPESSICVSDGSIKLFLTADGVVLLEFWCRVSSRARFLKFQVLRLKALSGHWGEGFLFRSGSSSGSVSLFSILRQYDQSEWSVVLLTMNDRDIGCCYCQLLARVETAFEILTSLLQLMIRTARFQARVRSVELSVAPDKLARFGPPSNGCRESVTFYFRIDMTFDVRDL